MKTHYNNFKVVNISSPVDVGAGAVTPKVASMRHYGSAFLYVSCGALADSPVLQIRQAQNVGLSGLKALTVPRYGLNLTTNSPAEEEDRWDETVSDVTTIALADNTNYIIPILPGMLDVQNDFDCIGAEIEDPGVGANLVSVQLFLMDGPRGIAGNIDHIPAATVNQMPN